MILNVVSVVLAIVVLAIYFPEKPIKVPNFPEHTNRFSAVMAIFNMIFRYILALRPRYLLRLSEIKTAAFAQPYLFSKWHCIAAPIQLA